MKLFIGFLQSTIAMQIRPLCDVTDLIRLLGFLSELTVCICDFWEWFF